MERIPYDRGNHVRSATSEAIQLTSEPSSCTPCNEYAHYTRNLFQGSYEKYKLGGCMERVNNPPEAADRRVTRAVRRRPVAEQVELPCVSALQGSLSSRTFLNKFETMLTWGGVTLLGHGGLRAARGEGDRI
jgi:hypothetical protein